jgi:hypothetical protein
MLEILYGPNLGESLLWNCGEETSLQELEWKTERRDNPDITGHFCGCQKLPLSNNNKWKIMASCLLAESIFQCNVFYIKKGRIKKRYCLFIFPEHFFSI